MNLKLNKYSYLFFAICFFIAAAIIESRLLKKHPETHLIEDFQKEFANNERQLNKYLEVISEEIILSGFDGDFSTFFKEHDPLIDKMGFAFLIYKNGELEFWSDRAVAFFNNLKDFEKTSGLVKLGNGYYFSSLKSFDDYNIVGLHLIKSEYRYENKYLQNKFFKSYKLPNEYKISELQIEGVFHVFSLENNFLFSIIPIGDFLCTTNQLYFPAIIYFFGLLILLFYFRKEFIEKDAPFLFKILGLGSVLFIVYWLHLIFKIPKVLFYLKFFSPDYFAVNSWLPSLGDFFLLTLFFFFWLYNFGIDLSVKQLQNNSKLPRKIIIILLFLFNASLYLLSNFLIEVLIFNSTLSFSLNKIIEISAQSVLGIFSVGLILLSVIFFTIRITEQARDDFKLIEFIGVATGIVLFLAVVQLISVGKVNIAILALFFVCLVLASLFSKNYLQKFTLSYLIIFVSVTSIYSLVIFYQSIAQKEREQQKLLAVTLVTERDPAAEVFLSEIQFQINKDPAIQSLLIQNEDPREYIESSYFTSYFRKYLINIYVCNSEDSLLVAPENRMVPCMPYLDDLIESGGVQIPGTNFYFIDNMNGRISYTGKLQYILSSDSNKVTIYIDLDSDLLFEGIGFPELLMDKSITRSENYLKFNYAKYYGGELTNKFGDHNYNFYVDNYLSSDDEFIFLKRDNVEHLVYHSRENNYVIVSRDIINVISYLISFPYLFVFYFLSVLIILVIGNRTIRNRQIIFDLKFKIQAAIISIVFISLLLVALVTILYNVEEYKAKHQNDLNDKMKSISEEIDNRLEDKAEITSELVIWLHRELAKLSNIFRTDINIYGTNGDLIASSRSEIFEDGLVSTRINSRAFYEIFENSKIIFFQPENIGELSFLSAYRPIINNTGNHLGCIHLPYFIKQDNYSQEITTFVVAFINLYVLLFLVSIIIAVFIANQITRPLVVIQENLQKMELGKHNAPILYNRNDEIGSLVKEYNKKVDELAVSADLLARSERESAWREMAKQIAHEIKNPLTPMKLNIQYLQRTKGQNEEYNNFLERVTGTLIEQIDNLSNIATEFSNFAKIPTARNQVFCLSDQVQKVIDLYETHDKAKIYFNPNNQEKIKVNADREQLSRAIINLIKNGIQAIPENQVGEIKIWLERREHMAVIAVKDNGSGIPLEQRDKLFSPSFTTKTSGMGLGLAIVKNIVENFSGIIWFETHLKKGTTFFLEIPVYKNEEEV